MLPLLQQLKLPTMFLRKLSLIQFKSYSQVDLEFSPRINVFTGHNGVGKTNLLDAIHYLSLCKSYFNAVDSQNIQHDKDFMVIEGWYERNGMEEHIYCGVKRNQKKQFRRNKKEYQKLSDHIGLIPLVIITPEDNSLIQEGSEERRKFLNGVISQYDRSYLEDLITYNHALMQRNHLLKTLPKKEYVDYSNIELWDEQMIPPGIRVFEKRQEFIQKLVPVFQKYYNFISLNREEVELRYHSQLTENNFRDLLRNNFEKDRFLEYTSTGIHKDDIILGLHDHPLRRIGSQGQQKTFLVALKLAQYEFIRELNGQPPILLLDDIFDKFDADRVQQIIRLVAEDHFGQIFIADTNKHRINTFLTETKSDFSFFEIENNRVFLKNISDEKK